MSASWERCDDLSWCEIIFIISFVYAPPSSKRKKSRLQMPMCVDGMDGASGGMSQESKEEGLSGSGELSPSDEEGRSLQSGGELEAGEHGDQHVGEEEEEEGRGEEDEEEEEEEEEERYAKRRRVEVKEEVGTHLVHGYERTEKEEGPPPDAATLVFDTETTGLNGTVVQLAFVLLDEGGKEVGSSVRYLRLLPGEVVGERARQVHGITDDELDSKGEDAVDVLSDFDSECRRVLGRGGRVVAHNASFDFACVQRTASKAGACLSLGRGDVFCTMQAGRLAFPFFNKNGRRKNPSNEELYETFFGSLPTGKLHDALVDSRVTAASFAEGKKRGIW